MPGWRSVYTNDYGNPDFGAAYFAVSATSMHNAWVVGGTDYGPVAVRWQGTRWHVTNLPGGLAGRLSSVSADTPSDAWAVSQDGTYLLHWHGSRWRVAKTWPRPNPAYSNVSGYPYAAATVLAFSPADVWVFNYLGTWHLNGSSWTVIAPAGLADIGCVSPLSRRDIWALTYSPSGPTSIVHFRNGHWLRASGEALNGGRFESIAALSDDSIWASARNGNYLVHLTATGWIKVTLPWRNMTVRRLVPDGSGGLWMLADKWGYSSGSYFVHLSAAQRWTRLSTGEYGPDDIVLIPGTRSLWSVGMRNYSVGSDGAAYQAKIFAYGHIG